MPFKYGIVITGLIASGKSSVCELLKKRGYEIICADNIAHDLLDSNAHKIAKLFGVNFIKNAKVDRAKLGALIFGDKETKAALEELLHPLIYDEILRNSRILEEKKKIYFVDIPLFFESGRDYGFKKVLVVYAPKELCLKRLMARNKLSKSDASARIEAQMNIEIKKQKANFVLENSGDLKDLDKNLDEILQKLQG